MRRVCLAFLLCCVLPSAASAAPCVPGSLASYVALGVGGCSVGTTLFSDFSSLPVQPGATSIADSSTLVNPVDVAYRPGLRFDVGAVAGAGAFLQRMIGFSVSNAAFTGNQLTLAGSSATPDGAVTVIERKCLGQRFVSGTGLCAGAELSLVAFDLGLDQSLTEALSLSPVGLLGIVLNIGVDGGTGGAASLGSATAEFTAVPEPATLTLLGLGTIAGLVRRRRASRAGVGPGV